MAASLAALWKANRDQDGFVPTLTTNHYAWTYGPTAVLIVVVGLWRQVDYNCKILQPWQELREGPASAERSVDLDYIGPLNFTSFVRTWRFRHWPVFSSILGFSLLKLATVLSTGLLVLEPVTVNEAVNVTLTGKFDTSKLWKIPRLEFIFPTWAAHAVDNGPAYTYLGMLENDVRPPTGTQHDVAFQPFNLPAGQGLQHVYTEVDVFKPSFRCDIADITLQKFGNGTNSRMARLALPSCPSMRVSLNRRASCLNNSTICAQTRLEQYLVPFNCSSTPDVEYEGFAVIVSNVTYTRPDRALPDLDMAFGDTAAVVCRPGYSMNRANITVSPGLAPVSIGPLSPRGKLGNFTAFTMGKLFLATLNSAREDLGGNYGPSADNPRAIMVHLPNDPVFPFSTDLTTVGIEIELVWTRFSMPFWHLLLHTLHGDLRMDRFLSPTVLRDASMKVCNGLAAQIARTHFLQPDVALSKGVGTFSEDRLHTGDISLWMMVFVFLALMACALYILCTAPRDLVSHGPSSIMTSALLLARSPEMQHLLVQKGHMNTGQLATSLRSSRFQTANDGRICVRGGSACSEPTSRSEKRRQWQPFAARYYVVFLTFGCPIVVIALLEVLYAYSKRHQGIVDVTGTESSATYLSRYATALLMVFIATLFNSLDFTVSSFAPYSNLRAGSVSAARGLGFHLLGNLPPMAIFKSLRRRHYASALSNFAGMLGSILTIISSGLWIVDRDAVQHRPVEISLAHSWNASWYNSSLVGDGGAAVALNNIQHGSTTMGPFIWDDYVLPELTGDPTTVDNLPDKLAGLSSRNYTFEMRALHPRLDCEVVAGHNINVWLILQWIHIDATIPLPVPCQQGGKHGRNPYYNVSTQLDIRDDGYRAGKFLDLHLGPLVDYTAGTGNYTYSVTPPEVGEPSPGPDNMMGCPSIGVVFGQVSWPNTTHEVTVLSCSQRMEEVVLNVTYHGDRVSTPALVGADAPHTIIGKSHYLTNGSNGFDAFPYRPQTYLCSSGDSYAPESGAYGNLTFFGDHNAEQTGVDSFFDHIVHGPDGTPWEEMLGTANQQKLIGAVQKLYNKYMTLVIDGKFRQRFASPSDTAVVPGQVAVRSSRLQIGYESKMVLQVMLAIMTVLGALSFLLADLRGTLPRKPTSIASTMAFLAGSELCDSHTSNSLLPEAADTMSSRELERFFDGWLFSLGWWPVRAGTESRVSEAEKPGRFGIDVGVPEQLGFASRVGWFGK